MEMETSKGERQSDPALALNLARFVKLDEAEQTGWAIVLIFIESVEGCSRQSECGSIQSVVSRRASHLLYGRLRNY